MEAIWVRSRRTSLRGILVLLSICASQARFIPGRELLSATTETEISWFYPGRPFTTTDEVCTSRGDTCFGFVVGPNRFIECPPRSPAPYESVDEKCRTSEKTWLGTILTPRHVREDGLCEAARQKTLRDRFGRPMTIRYSFNGQTYVANREQVCELSEAQIAQDRATKAAYIDDYIWKNLSIWSKEFEYMWPTPSMKEQYLKCHESLAAFHCSNMFPNCTSENRDKKPALPCKELCEKTVEDCTYGEGKYPDIFLPYELKCSQYPSRTDPWKNCTEVFATGEYVTRIAAAPTIKGSLSMAFTFTVIAATLSAMC